MKTIVTFLLLMLAASSVRAGETDVFRLYVDANYDQEKNLFLDKDGKPVSGLLVWDSDGYLRETAMDNGRKHGLEKAWYKGNLISESQYQNGELHGYWRRYDLNGRLRNETKQPDDLRNLPGWTRNYNERGRPVSEYMFLPGKPINDPAPDGGTKWTYHEDGITLKTETPYDLGGVCSKAMEYVFDRRGRIVGAGEPACKKTEKEVQP